MAKRKTTPDQAALAPTTAGRFTELGFEVLTEHWQGTGDADSDCISFQEYLVKRKVFADTLIVAEYAKSDDGRTITLCLWGFSLTPKQLGKTMDKLQTAWTRWLSERKRRDNTRKRKQQNAGIVGASDTVEGIAGPTALNAGSAGIPQARRHGSIGHRGTYRGTRKA